MELFLFRPGDYALYYNCSGIAVDSVPLAQRQKLAPGLLLLTMFIVFHTLYVLCLVSIRRQIRQNVCYQFLFFIGVVDLCALWVVGFLTGLLGVLGGVFCSSPTLIYVAGTFADAMWAAESTAEVLLAVNRCLDILAPNISALLFNVKRTWIWFMCISLYACWWFLYVKALCFSSIYFSWSYDPLVGYQPGLSLPDYSSDVVDNVHDLIVMWTFPSVYACFCVGLVAKMYNLGSSGANLLQSHAQKMAFLQVLILCFLHSFNMYFGQLIGRYMDQLPHWMSYDPHFNWFLIHGIPPVLYLTLNKSIRTDCNKMVSSFLRRIRTASIAAYQAMINDVSQQQHTSVVHVTTAARRVHPANTQHQQRRGIGA